MRTKTVVLLGRLAADRSKFIEPARRFGWSVGIARAPGELRETASVDEVVAVLFDPREAGSWEGTVRMLAGAAPGAYPVACHAFSDPIDWPAMAEAGVFHALRFPFEPGEVRQTFGFVSAARRKRLASSALESASAPEQQYAM